MRITHLTLWHVAVPLPAVFRPAWIPGFPQTENRFTLARIRTASGIEGFSAGPAMSRERQGLGDLIGPYFIGERADDIASVRQRLREMSYLGWHAGWLEAACWDVIGKQQGKPVWQLLGGQGGRVRLYGSTGELRTGKERVAEVEALLAAGFETVKLRVHAPTLDEDVAQVAEVRRAVGDKVGIGVDANQGWRVAVVGDAPRWDVQRATAFCQHMGELGVQWVEEPLANDDHEGMAALRAASPVAIAGAELNHGGLPEIRSLLRHGCLDVYQPDAVFAGGIAETWGIVRAVAEAGARYTPHTWTNGIGFAINLQLFAASPWRDRTHLEYPLAPPGWVPEARDGLLQQPWRHERGFLELPTAPGLGFAIDGAQLARHGHCFFRGSKLRVAVAAVLDKGLSVAREVGATRQARLDARAAEIDSAKAGGQEPWAPFVAPVPPLAAGGP